MQCRLWSCGAILHEAIIIWEVNREKIQKEHNAPDAGGHHIDILEE